jgi:hypothetical protein
MANTVIQLKHSTLTGNVPSSLANGEISINNRDGKFFYSTPASVIITHYPYLGPAGLNKEIQFNDSGTLGSNAGLAFDKTSGSLNVSNAIIVGGRNLDVYANAAFIHANAAFNQANTGGGGTTDFGFGIIYTANNNTFANAAAANSQVNFVGESGVVVFANSITKTITFAGTPGAQGLTVDYGFVNDPVFYSIDYGTL